MNEWGGWQHSRKRDKWHGREASDRKWWGELIEGQRGLGAMATGGQEEASAMAFPPRVQCYVVDGPCRSPSS